MTELAYFQAFGVYGVGGDDLFTSDGTVAGTSPVGGLGDAGVSGVDKGELSPESFFVFGDKALFLGESSTVTRGLWVTDGTAAGTFELGGLNNAGIVGKGSGTLSYLSSEIVALGDEALFAAGDAGGYTELWITNGTSAGTTEVGGLEGKGIAGFGSVNEIYTSLNGKAFLGAYDTSGDLALWATNGTSAGTIEIGGLKNAGVTGDNDWLGGVGDWAVFGGKMIFESGLHLWATNGTAAGTVEIGGHDDLSVGADDLGFYPHDMTAFGLGVIFTGSASNRSEGLWFTNGTTADTYEIGGLDNAGIAGAPAAGLTQTSYAAGASLGDKVVFNATDAAGEEGLWVTDGTAAGTFELGGLADGGIAGASATGLNAQNFASYGSEVLFDGNGTNGEDLWETDGTTVGTHVVYTEQANGLVVVGNVNPPNTSHIPNAFTGDGRSDVLFRSATASSALATWQLDDTSITGGGSLANPGPAWTYEGDGDFYGNGDSDALWRNQNGQLAIWEMKGTAIVGSATLGSPGGTWSVVGEGDFYGNGHSDILFQDASGNLSIWEMNGGAIVGGGLVGNPGASYRLVGIGDFNGDGQSDLLFESAAGQFAIWNLSGTAISGSAVLGSPGAGWVYKGIGDFNGAGDSDILFENINTGVYATWDIADDKISGGGNIGNPGAAWTLEAIGDYATTGRSSLLFENTSTGQLTSWDLDDTQIVGGGNIGDPGPAYQVVQGAPAIQAQPAPTLTFINSTSGQIAEWDINATAITGAGVLGTATGYTALAVGDFNGDGQSDVLFVKAGAYAIWEANGEALTGGGTVGSPGSAYTYKGVGDFNGDGKSDILFEEANGTYATWDLSGTQIGGGGALGNPGAGLTYVGAGDFTGDGTSDLLLTDTSGHYWISFVSENKIIGTSEIGNPGAGYTLAAIGDLNSDGKADLLFSHNGALSSWDLNGASIIGGGSIGSPGSAFAVVGIADLGNTSHASIVFDNASGQVATWLMNDTSIIGGGTIGTAAGYNILGVR